MEAFFRLIDVIEATETLHPFIPGFLKVSLAALIVLVSFLPISILSFILSWSFGNLLSQAASFLEKSSNTLHSTSLICWARSRRAVSKLYQQYRLFINYENPSFRTDEIPAQAALDHIKERLPKFGDTITKFSQTKAHLLEDLNNLLRGHGQSTQKLIEEGEAIRELQVPQIEIDPSQEQDRKSALAIIYIMAPLLLAAGGANSFLLNEFFYELNLRDRVFLDVRLSHIIAVMFTLIEIGVGALIARQELNSDNNIVAISFLWCITALLAFIEMGMYSMLAVAISDSGDFRVRTGEVIANLSFQTFFQYQLWLTFLGPAIVLCLAMFGKSLAAALFKLMSVSQLEQTKTSLDNLFSNQTSVLNMSAELRSQIDLLVQAINKEDIKLSNMPPSEDQWESVKGDWQTLINETQNSINRGGEFEYQAPNFHSENLDDQEAARLAQTKLFYALIPLASVPLLALFLSYAAFASFATIGLIAFVVLGSTYLAGYLCTRQQNIFKSSTEDRSELIQSKARPAEFAAGIIIAAGALVFLTYAFYFAPSSPQVAGLGVSLLVIGVCFYSGREMMHALPALVVFATSAGWQLAAISNSILRYATAFLGIVITTISKTIWGLSFPMRYLMGN